jgi:probable HAF family extracellular repeat protein
LPSLGGSNPDITVLGVGNGAWSINNHGVIAGQSTLLSNTVWHPVLWRRGRIADLGVLPGDLVGAALEINNRNEVVGASISAPGPSSGNPRAFLWRNGVMTDLNSLVPPNSPLHLLTAFAINDSGEIVGFGVNQAGDLHGFLAKPCDENSRRWDSDDTRAAKHIPPVLSEHARSLLMEYWLRRH